jgi:hypothetical protein
VAIGDLCEGDGECGTNHFLNNCQCGIFKCDVYRKTDTFSPTTSPTHLISYIPSPMPTDIPSEIPSDIPSEIPSDIPSDLSTDIPSEIPSDIPSEIPSEIPSDLPTDIPSEIPSDLPTDIPTDLPTDIPTDLPSTDPCQTYDTSLLCPLDTNYSECSAPIIKALCPYLCAGCVSLSPISPPSNTIVPSDVIGGSASQEQNKDKNKKSIGIITGCSALVVVLIVIFIFLRKKDENIYEQPKMISTIDTNSNKCIQNEIYVPTEYMSPTLIHYDLGNNTEPNYDLACDDGYLQTELYEEFRAPNETDF